MNQRTNKPTMPTGFPYGVPLILYPLLAIALSAVQRNLWLTALVELALLILAVMFARLAFSRADFEKARAGDKSLNLATWRINWLLFFSVPPALLALYGAARAFF